MDIEYREVNKESFFEVRYFKVTHEFAFRDSDPKNFVPKTEEQRDISARKMMDELEKGEEKVYLLAAFHENKMIGSHFLERYTVMGKKVCHIHGLWVDSNYRGHGIAKKLKELGEEWGRLKNCDYMDSNVLVTNEAMITLNKNLGYSIARYNFRKPL